MTEDTLLSLYTLSFPRFECLFYYSYGCVVIRHLRLLIFFYVIVEQDGERAREKARLSCKLAADVKNVALKCATQSN